MKIADLLDETKTAQGLKTDGELARLLGVTKQAVSKYYNGERIPDEYACLKIAEALGKPLNTIIATVKASTEKDEKRREAWENYMKRLGGFAASLTLSFFLVVIGIMTISPANAGQMGSPTGQALYYVN